MTQKSGFLYKLKWLGAFVVIILGGAVAGTYFIFQASLPNLDENILSIQIDAPVNVVRDEKGNVTVSASNRLDLAYTTGFIHAQERFFQMDLSRRMAAGELSELFGPLALQTDKANRLHRFRTRAKSAISLMSEDNKALLKKYVAGINDGLNELGSNPFEYWLLQQDPAPWTEEDSFLVIYSMFFALQSGSIEAEWHKYYIENSLDHKLAEFLLPKRTEWDAPLQANATPWQPQEIPSSNVLASHTTEIAFSSYPETLIPGSNNWAVSGKIANGKAGMLSNDMHLGIRAPATWYRLRLKLNDNSLDISGVSLPGTPLIIVGSNGNVAWGYTNSFVDTADLVDLKINPDNEQQYLTVNGYQNFKIYPEEIKVNGGETETITIRETIWGPVSNRGGEKDFAIKWVAHQAEAVNMGLARMEQVKTVSEAIAIAAGNGIPTQNAMLVDRYGNIGWTHFGALPRRKKGDYSGPGDWSTGELGWDGWLNTDEKPKVYNPADNRLWTANSRVVSGEDFDKVGDGGADLGARQKQIRDNLFDLKQDVSEQDLYAIQRDNRAIFWERWQKQLLSILKKSSDKDLEQFIHEVENWGGRAEVQSVGFRLVKNYRKYVQDALISHLTSPCAEKFKKCRYHKATNQMESPLWRLVDMQPQGWLPAKFNNDWQGFFEHRAKSAWEPVLSGKIKLQDYIWGEQNRAQIKHPLSGAVPLLSMLTDMPMDMQNGAGSNMPHIAAKSFGQSERIVVSPGREETGIMNIPAGQSGHPLSPYYGAGHDDWQNGVMTPFLPGKTKWTFDILPIKN